MLLDRRLGEIFLQRLDIGCHMEWLDIDQLAKLMSAFR
jgi:hypothetical protein